MKKLIALLWALYGLQATQAAIESPVALPATDVTTTSFTANWQPVEAASGYQLNVFAYTMADSGTPETSITESFEGLVPTTLGSKRNKYIDFDRSTLSEGWSLDVTGGSVRQLYTTTVATDTTSVHSGTIALAFDSERDSIVTPILPAPASRFSFWVKNANGNGTVAAYGYDGNRWSLLGETSTIYYPAGGIVEYSREIPVGCIRFKITYTDEAPDMNSPTAIDDIAITYGGMVKTRDYLIEGLETTNTSVPVSGLQPDTDYFYTVQSIQGNERSAESNIVDVFGFAGSLETPRLNDFTEVHGGQYTANWSTVIGADGYVLYNIYTHTAQRDEPGQTVLYENFDAFTGGTVELPVDDMGGTNYDDYTTVPDWSAFYGCWTGGMLGGISISTPTIAMSNTGGYTAKARIYGAMGDQVDFNNYYQTGNAEKKSVTLSHPGYNEVTITFDHSSPTTSLEIYFRQRDYTQEMYLDELTLTQDLSTGDSFSYNYDYRLVEGRRINSYTFTDLPQAWGDRFAFRMSAYAESDGKLYQSSWTALTEVPLPASVENLESDPAGVKVMARPGGLVVRLQASCPLTVYNLQGQLVRQQPGLEGDNTLDLQPGLYLLRCGNHTLKVVVP